MSERTAREAIRETLDRSRRVLGCVTTANQVIPHDAGGERMVTMAPPRREGVRLRHTLPLELQFGYTVQLVEVGPPRRQAWESVVRRYFFTLLVSGQELIAFHWHPDVPGRPDPHLHLGPASQAVGLLRESHVPTGMLSLADVLRYAIGELGVEPVRRDWETILRA